MVSNVNSRRSELIFSYSNAYTHVVILGAGKLNWLAKTALGDSSHKFTRILNSLSLLQSSQALQAQNLYPSEQQRALLSVLTALLAEYNLRFDHC